MRAHLNLDVRGVCVRSKKKVATHTLLISAPSIDVSAPKYFASVDILAQENKTLGYFGSGYPARGNYSIGPYAKMVHSDARDVSTGATGATQVEPKF